MWSSVPEKRMFSISASWYAATQVASLGAPPSVDRRRRTGWQSGGTAHGSSIENSATGTRRTSDDTARMIAVRPWRAGAPARNRRAPAPGGHADHHDVAAA